MKNRCTCDFDSPCCQYCQKTGERERDGYIRLFLAGRINLGTYVHNILQSLKYNK